MILNRNIRENLRDNENEKLIKEIPNFKDEKNRENLNISTNSNNYENDSEDEKKLIEKENNQNHNNKNDNKLFYSSDINVNQINLEKLKADRNYLNQKISIEENGNNVNINSPEVLVNTLRDAIEDTNKQYRILRKEFIDEVKKKTESQQLLQKCIEDIKLEISLSAKDLQIFSNISYLNNLFNKINSFLRIN